MLSAPAPYAIMASASGAHPQCLPHCVVDHLEPGAAGDGDRGRDSGGSHEQTTDLSTDAGEMELLGRERATCERWEAGNAFRRLERGGPFSALE